jgi:serine O-acetyltransferase
MSLREIIKEDARMYGCDPSILSLAGLYFKRPGFYITFWFRLINASQGEMWWRRIIRLFLRVIYRHASLKTGVDISYRTIIGPGLYIPHTAAIVINGDCQLGAHVYLGHEVTLGATHRGKNKGCPRLGSRVFVGPGAKVFGDIAIGDDAAIGANAVVIDAVPAQAVVGGIPAKIISMQGSEGLLPSTRKAAHLF